MTDLNTKFANLERTYANNARQFRDRAASLSEQCEREKAQNYGPPEVHRDIDRAYADRVAQAEKTADRWEARRREAANGFFLCGPDDLNDAEYISEYSDVMSEAQQAGRVVYRTSSDDDELQRVTSGDLPNLADVNAPH